MATMTNAAAPTKVLSQQKSAFAGNGRALAPARRCVSRVWNHYLTLIDGPGAKPGDVDDKVLSYAAHLYAQGECEPTAPPTQAAAHRGPLGLWPEAG